MIYDFLCLDTTQFFGIRDIGLLIFLLLLFQTSGDFNLARRCLRLCLSSDGAHGAALNNLAVIAAYFTQFGKANSYLTAAKTVLPNSEEVEHNSKLITKHV